MSAELSPHIPDAEPIGMSPSYRVIKRLLTVIPAVGLFLLLNANPFAQSTKLPAPTSHINDFAGVLDAETKSRLENLLQRLKEKSNFELYVATVDTTGAQEISAFSNQLARDWNIGTKLRKARVCCSSFQQRRRRRSHDSVAPHNSACRMACWVK